MNVAQCRVVDAPARAKPGGVVGEHLAVAAVVDTPIARDPHPQLGWMPDDRHIADPAFDAVGVGPGQSAARAPQARLRCCGANPVIAAARPLSRGVSPRWFKAETRAGARRNGLGGSEARSEP
jgi:hypothetical protein